MTKAILCCSCGQVPARAAAAYSVKFRDPLPPSYIGKDQLRELLSTLPLGSPAAPYIKALIASRQRFAYYMEWDDATVSHQYDLLKGKELT